MIEINDLPPPSGVEPALMDYGQILRPSTGAAVLRVARKGGRFRLTVSHPPMPPEQSRIMVSRLLRAKNEGLRLNFPLLGIDQGAPGAPVVNATAPTGYSLPVRGLTPGYKGQEGFWLSIVDSAGQHYLHNVTANFMADVSGFASISITPALRVPFANGAAIHLAQPKVQGFVDGDSWGWTVPVDRLVAVAYPLEEAA